MRLTTAVEQFLADCKMRGLAPATIYHYKSDLGLLTALAKFHATDSVLAFNGALVRMYMLQMSAKDLSMATLHRRRAALSQFSKWGQRARVWADDPSVELPSVKRPKRLPRPFAPEERERLLALPLGKVDTLLRAVLFYTGLRVSSVCALRVENVSTSTSGAKLRVPVKGGREHVMKLNEAVRELIVDFYVDLMSRGADLSRRAYLFEQANGRPWRRPMILRRVRRWGRLAEVRDCTPHRFRHTFGTRLVEQGVDIRTIARLMAHEDIATTMLYTEVADRQADDAVASLSFEGAETGKVTASGLTPPPETIETSSSNLPPTKENVGDGL